MTGKCTRLLLAAGLGVALLQSTTYGALATSDWSSNPIAPGHSPTLFEVSGDIQKPGKYTLRDLKQLPETNANVVFISGGSSTSAKWVGVLLWDFLQHVGIKVDPNPPVKNGILRKIIEFVASDDYVVKVAAGELAPNFGGHQVILVYAQLDPSDGKIKPLLDDSGKQTTRLVFPGDKAGGRAISWIKSIKIY